ncbi:PR-1-like protein [Stereum hirsutum FP-91666 SS1]|uniref:PR-1-like protein n=1 Tax=Stereum hirsutum (strain FP-91666) TaxID=721885 RepID=UPI000444962A|nr:PR-1-like protein [Stereum hirsutum FP-91666 SS1]EIM83311.1 PR-1-like protein [Stereum hirsutum FP-91666 SS1]
MSPSFTQLVSVALALAGSTLASPTLFATRASPSDIDSYLSAHNTVREAHGAADLVWNDTLATAAQNWANGCVFEHSGGSLGPYGENLAAGTGDFPIASAVGAWAAESTQYDASNPQPSHFTQMVWKASTQLGCAEAQCAIFDESVYGPTSYYVCEYYPAGNVIGQFPQNVQA